MSILQNTFGFNLKDPNIVCKTSKDTGREDRSFVIKTNKDTGREDRSKNSDRVSHT